MAKIVDSSALKNALANVMQNGADTEVQTSHTQGAKTLSIDQAMDVLHKVKANDQNPITQKDIAACKQLDAPAGQALQKAYQLLQKVDEGACERTFTEDMPLPRNWLPVYVLESGHLRPEGDIAILEDVVVPNEFIPLVDESMTYLWDVHLKWRTHDGSNVKIGDRENGTLRIGNYTDPDSGKTYHVCDWKDIDDGSYTLYFERKNNEPCLSLVQFNN